MAEPTTAGFNPIDTQMLADTLVPAIQSPTTFIAQDVRRKELEPDLSVNPSSKTNSLFGTPFKEEPRTLRGYANEYYEDANVQLSSGEYIPKYESYIPGTNNQERLAQNQTTSEKWVNGLEKFGLKTLVATVGGTLGVVDSLVEGISKGSLSEAYNTDFNNWLDDLNVQLDYKLPNYYTEQEQNASFLGQTTQANFWADKVFGGLSFTAGALISEGIWTAATGGVGLLASESQLGRLMKWTAKGVGGESKLNAALNAAKQTAKGSSKTLLETASKSGKFVGEGFGIGQNILPNIAESAKNASINAYKVKKLGDVALVALRSAGYEMSMEARQYMNSTEHAWLENYQKVNGTEPSQEEYAQFKDKLTTTANIVFAANGIIVGGSNIAQFGNALLGKTTNPLVGNNFLKRSLLGVGFDKEISEAGKVTYKALEATRGQKIAGKAWGVLGATIPESQEEMGQRVVSQTAENYMMNAFDPQKIKTTYGVADAFTQALNDTYGTKEGWSEGLIGGIVGVLGAGVSSRFKFGNVTAEREDVVRNVDYANNFTAENHLNNVIANTKIIYAQENKENAKQRGDLVGEILADSASAIQYIDRNLAIGNENEGVADFTRNINAVDNAELAKELGLGSDEQAIEQAKNFKEQKIAEFTSLSQKQKKNLNYAQALLGETEIAGLDKITTRELTRAMAFSMTMGEIAMKTNQDLVGHVKSIVAESIGLENATDAMDVQQILDLAPKEKTLKLSQLGLHLESLSRKEKEILNRQFEASKLTDTEDNKARANALIDINKELVQLQEDKQVAEGERQIALDSIGIRNYTDATITVDMFDNQNQNLDKLRATLKDIQLRDPEKYFEIQKALQAQAKAVQHIKNYQRTTQAIVNPNTRVKVLNGWITNLLNKNTKLNESTAAYFTDVLENWSTDTKITFQKNDNLKQREAFKKGEEVSEEYKQELGKEVARGYQLNFIDQQIYDAYQKEIEDNAKAAIEDNSPVDIAPKGIDTLESLKRKVTEIISSNDYLTKYFGSDLAEQNKTKPSESDVKEYEELLAKIDRKVEPNTDRIVSRPTGFYKNLGLTDEETNRLKELQTKLNDWLTLEGTVTQDNQSVAEMLDLIDALQTQAVGETVKTEYTDKDYTTVLEATDEQASSMGSSVRGLKTPTSALVSKFTNKAKGITNLRFSHIRVQTLASFFPNSSLIVNENKTFEIGLSSGEVLAGKINERGGQDVPLKEWEKVQLQSNVLIKNFGTMSSAISQFLGLDSQGKELYQNVSSDFDYQQTDGTNLEIDQVAVNQTKNGDTLDLFVSSTDAFNAGLSKSELPKQIHIYVMRGGKLIGSLPAPNTTEEGEVKENVDGIGISLMDLRNSASEFTKGKEGLIKLPQKMTAQITFIGAPQITLEKNGQEVVTKNNPFTKEMLQNVVGQGFIENGNVTSTVKIDVNQFINKISGSNRDAKIPFVAFNYNGKVVAFPISLTSFTFDRSEPVLEVFNSAEATTAVKAKTLVDALIQNKLNPQSYGIDFTDKEGWIDSPETERALEDLSKIKEFVDVERFATKNYNKENLIADASIAIDISNTPFQTSKIMLGMSNKIDSDVLGYREFLEESEQKEIETRRALNEVVRQLEIAYLNNEDLDNTFTQTFDENPIVQGEGDIVMRKNINTLKTAIKGASQNTKKIIGIDLFKRANDLLNQLKFSAKKVKDVKEQIKNSEYYQDADVSFITVDENGELENPNINQEEAIQKLGGIKTQEEFTTALENSDLEYLKTQPYSSKNLPKIAGEFTVVEVRDFTEYGQNTFTPQQQLKFNQGQNYEPVRIIADPRIIELISIGAKVNKQFDGKPQNINTVRQKELERTFNISASEANNKAKELARNNRDSSNERFIILGDVKIIETRGGSQLFQEMSQFNNIPVKEIVDGELVDKVNTEVRDTLEATLKEPENNALEVTLNNIEGYSSTVWNTSPQAVKTLLKDIKKQALTINVDLRGLSETYDTKSQAEILNVTRSLDFMLKNPTEATMDNFINVYQDFTGVIQEVERAVVKVEEKYRELPLVKLETEDSEYKVFKEQGLLKVQDDVYIKTDANEKSLAEVEDLMATNVQVFPAGTIQADLSNKALVKEDLNSYVESQMADVLTNDAEYDVDAVKKLIYYKTYFGTETSKTAENNHPMQLSQLSNVEITNRDYLTGDFIATVRNKQLRGENAVLDNLIFSDKGIQLKYTDEISVDAMNEYLKEDEDLRNYFLISKNTNFEVTGVDSNELISERDIYVNGATKEIFTDNYKTINAETVQAKTSDDFISIGLDNYERVSSDFFAKLDKNESGFLTINNSQPTLNVDTANYNSAKAEAEIEVKNKYSKEEGKNIDDSLDCYK